MHILFIHRSRNTKNTPMSLYKNKINKNNKINFLLLSCVSTRLSLLASKEREKLCFVNTGPSLGIVEEMSFTIPCLAAWTDTHIPCCSNTEWNCAQSTNSRASCSHSCTVCISECFPADHTHPALFTMIVATLKYGFA